MEDDLYGVLAAQGVMETCVALLDFPDYRNVGDSLIWLAEKEVLRQLDCRVVYAADLHSFDAVAMTDALGPDGIVVLSGGGNLGDLWPAHEQFRERIVATWSGRRIVQLPQSVFFADEDAARRARDVFAAHPLFTLLVRDRESLRRSRQELGIEAVLAPDMAMALDACALPPVSGPSTDIRWLARTDHESLPGAAADRASDGPMPVDWVDPATYRPRYVESMFQFLRRLRRRIARHQRGASRMAGRMRGIHVRLCHVQASMEVARGERVLRSSVVVTDRLHAHVLATLMGIPNVVVDNSYGKVLGCIDAWVRDHPLVHVARDVDEALALAEVLLAGTTPRTCTIPTVRRLVRRRARNQPAPRRGDRAGRRGRRPPPASAGARSPTP